MLCTKIQARLELVVVNSVCWRRIEAQEKKNLLLLENLIVSLHFPSDTSGETSEHNTSLRNSVLFHLKHERLWALILLSVQRKMYKDNSSVSLKLGNTYFFILQLSYRTNLSGPALNHKKNRKWKNERTFFSSLHFKGRQCKDRTRDHNLGFPVRTR